MCYISIYNLKTFRRPFFLTLISNMLLSIQYLVHFDFGESRAIISKCRDLTTYIRGMWEFYILSKIGHQFNTGS